MTMKINRKMLPMKAHLFFFSLATGTLFPFISVFARQLGFSSIAVGVIYTVLPIFSIFADVFIGALADWLKSGKTIFLISILVCGSSYFGMIFVPELPAEQKAHLFCNETTYFFDNSPAISDDPIDECLMESLRTKQPSVDCLLICTNFTTNTRLDLNNIVQYNKKVIAPLETFQKNFSECYSQICDLHCTSYQINEMFSKYLDRAYLYHQFWIFFTLTACLWVTGSILICLGDAILFEMMSNIEDFGLQRLFGSFGYGLGALITGFMIDELSHENSKRDYSPAIYLSVVGFALDFLVSYKFDYKQQNHSKSIVKDISKLLASCPIIIYLLWCLTCGMCVGIIWSFEFWLVEDLARAQGCRSMDWVKTLEGALMAVQTFAGEMPFFYFSGRIIKKMGHIHTMSFVLLAVAARLILYSLISNPWYFLPIEVLNGVTYALFYTCMASYASIIAPPGTEATMQGIVAAVYEGGVSLGSAVAGLLYEHYGGVSTFRIFGIGALVICFLHVIAQWASNTREKYIEVDITEKAPDKITMSNVVVIDK